MPKNLNNAKITQRLVESFQLKGRYIPMLDEVIVPVYVLDDPAPAAPNRLAGGFVKIDGADDPNALFFNPPGSGVMMVVTSVVVQLSKTTGPQVVHTLKGFMRRQSIGVDVSTDQSAQWRDNRIRDTISDTPLGTFEATIGSQPGGRQLFERAVPLEVGTADLLEDVIASPQMGPRQPPIVLSPDNGFLIVSLSPVAEAINLIMNVLWEEIPLMGGVAIASGTPP